VAIVALLVVLGEPPSLIGEPPSLIVFETSEDSTPVGVDGMQESGCLGDDGPGSGGLVELGGGRVAMDLEVARTKRVGRDNCGDLEQNEGAELWLEREVARIRGAELHAAS
jgi:hypothetical protein